MNEIAFENAEFHLNCKGYVTGANYSAKRGTFIFFINRKYCDDSGPFVYGLHMRCVELLC